MLLFTYLKNQAFPAFRAGWAGARRFQGRSSRSEYLGFLVAYLLVLLFFLLLDFMLSMMFLSSIYLIYSFFPLLAFSARRLHDAGYSAWCLGLLFLLPLPALISYVGIWLLLIKGLFWGCFVLLLGVMLMGAALWFICSRLLASRQQHDNRWGAYQP